jgi:dTDP-4-amino-4,6-dideoxygalactose transaminase
MNFNVITEFENKVAKFFGAPYAIAVDSCTHGVEFALRYTNTINIKVPNHNYL